MNRENGMNATNSNAHPPPMRWRGGPRPGHVAPREDDGEGGALDGRRVREPGLGQALWGQALGRRGGKTEEAEIYPLPKKICDATAKRRTNPVSGQKTEPIVRYGFFL